MVSGAHWHDAAMRGLMQDYPLTVDSMFRHVEQHHGDGTIVTNNPGGVTRTTYAEWARRARGLGGVLDELGVSSDGRVGTFAWNTARHLELYFAAPCTGRVLHTLNIRLFPEQLRFVADHAQDEVIFADRSLLKLLWPLIDELPSVRHVIVPVVPMFHANAWGLAQAGVLAGSTFVMPGPDLSPKAIADLMESEKVTFAAGVPTIWMGVLDELEGRDLSSLTRILCGGSAVPKSLSEAYREKIGVPMTQGWGMTETSPLGSVSYIRTSLRDRAEEELADIRALQGIPSPLVEIRIADPDTDEAQPWDGESRGEVQCAGPWIAAGYYGGAGEAQFTDDGWLRTGDVGVMTPEGYLKLVDRTKDLVKSGGEWISSVELENEIMAHPQVKEAAVIGVRDDKWGERPLACVVPEEGAQLDAGDIRGFLEGRVAKRWIPESVEFIDEVPKTSVGKFSKKTLREQFSEVAT